MASGDGLVRAQLSTGSAPFGKKKRQSKRKKGPRRSVTVTDEAKTQNRKALAQLTVGSVQRAVVKRSDARGVLLELNGSVQALVTQARAREAERQGHPFLRVGREVEVKVGYVNPAAGSLSVELVVPATKDAGTGSQKVRAKGPKPKTGAVVVARLVGGNRRVLELDIDGHLAEAKVPRILENPSLRPLVPVGTEVFARVVGRSGKVFRADLTDVTGSMPDEAKPPVPLHRLLQWRARGFNSALDIARWAGDGWDPDQARPWSKAGFDPVSAARWRRSGASAATAAPWRDWDFEQAQRWIAADIADDQAAQWKEHDPETAKQWIVGGWGPKAARGWMGLGLEPDVASEWRRHGVRPAAAEAWLAFGVPPELAARGEAAGVGPPHLKTWRSAGFEAEEALDWLKHKVARPSEARSWIRAGAGPETAGLWVGYSPAAVQPWSNAGWEPAAAVPWMDEGFESPREAARWRAKGWPPGRAALARRAGLLPTDELPGVSPDDWDAEARRLMLAEGQPGSERLPGPPGFDVRADIEPSAVKDALFGSPREPMYLNLWTKLTEQRLGVSAPISIDRRARSLAAEWHRPNRIQAQDAAILRDHLVLGLGSDSWEVAAAGALARAEVVLAEPADLDARFQASRIDAEMLPELRLPFERIVVFFGAHFEVPPRLRTCLPGWIAAQDRDRWSFEEWLTHIRLVGGGLVGVLLQADERTGVADECLWVVEVDGRHALVPGFRSRSLLEDLTDHLAAALCFGGWIRRSTPVRRSTGRRSNPSQAPARSRTLPRQIHTVVVKPAQRTDDTHQGGGSTTPHLRRAHWHRYWVGSHPFQELEWRWVDTIDVNGHREPDRPDRVYKLPSTLFRRR